jgi:hypothetical protein
MIIIPLSQLPANERRLHSMEPPEWVVRTLKTAAGLQSTAKQMNIFEVAKAIRVHRKRVSAIRSFQRITSPLRASVNRFDQRALADAQRHSVSADDTVPAPTAEPVSADHPVILAKPRFSDFGLGQDVYADLEEARRRFCGEKLFDGKPCDIRKQLVEQLLVIRRERIERSEQTVISDKIGYSDKVLDRYRKYWTAFCTWRAKYLPH